MMRTLTHAPVVFALLAIVALAPKPVPATAAEPLFEGLGTWSRKVTTTSPDAQRYFDQGLAFLYAFNHDEAIRSFRQAATLDPKCAMAWWGIATANGPHYNNPLVDGPHAEAAWDALEKARANVQGASAVERALIAAAGKRFAMPQPEDRRPLDEAYANALREARRAYPDDADVGALLAEALMDLRPWNLWTVDGKAQPGTDEVVATLEAVLARAPRHPLALHLTIHALEGSAYPDRADVAADRLRDLEPGLAHMVHMPSHIDVRRGRWKEAEWANEKAIAADARYRVQRPAQGFYRIYMLHNHHMLAFAALMRGESAKALRAIDTMIASVPEQWARENAVLADAALAIPLEVRMRFGRWDDVLAAPEPPAIFPVARALRHVVRGAAFAAQGRVVNARQEQQAFLRARANVPEQAKIVVNLASDVLDVAGQLLDGEILFREGKTEQAFAALREAVRREDALHYAEPPDWIIPVRHALGAALMQAGRYAEAERVYRDDLKRHPENGWSLFGLARSLELQGKANEAAPVKARFQKAWADADVTLTSSCYCQPGV